MSSKGKTAAVAYFRTSSITNVGADKDSAKRQSEAVTAFAKGAGYEIVGEFYDADVRGDDHVSERPAFADMMERLAAVGVRTIIVEAAHRFARDLIVQETGYRMLQDAGITLIAADSPDAFLDQTPTAVLIRQILGAVAQFDKAMTVAKLRGARERKRSAAGKCEGRKSHAQKCPEMVALAKKLARYPVHGRKRSLRDIADELAVAGYAPNGKPYAAMSVARMLAS